MESGEPTGVDIHPELLTVMNISLMEDVKDLIVDVNSTEVSIALMQNHRLIELNKESSQGHTFSVGDVYLGKVKKILPALNAAFVDIGDEKEAFSHPGTNHSNSQSSPCGDETSGSR